MKKIFPCVVGLGYVGLPVFISLKKKFEVVGFDTNKERVKGARVKAPPAGHAAVVGARSS